VAIAQTELAVRYEMGWGVPIDASASTKWLLKAVAQRDANALAVMGVRYEKGLGVPRDLNEAVRHYREAADAGHARAMCYLGDMYLGGLGVHANHTDAYRWHVAAIAAGDERCGTHANASGMSLSPEMRAQTELEGRALARQRSR
jgi:TPR repeat protein